MLILNLNISTKSQPVKVDKEWREGETGPAVQPPPVRNNRIDIATNISNQTYCAIFIGHWVDIVDITIAGPMSIYLPIRSADDGKCNLNQGITDTGHLGAQCAEKIIINIGK